MSRPRLLVSAGEVSGDALAAAVVEALGGVEARGLGGPALERAGVELVVHQREITGLGGVEVAGRLPGLARAFLALLREARRWRPDAALLVDLPDFNLPLGRRLRALGLPVLGLVAPQLWAWRSGRASSVGQCVDRLACILPFEERPLRLAGVAATFVGHPSAERPPIARAEARRTLGLRRDGPCLALLPGSRPAELDQLLPPMVAAAERLRRVTPRLEVTLPLAPGLRCPSRLPPWLQLTSAGAPEGGAGRLALAAADVALVASGTATLEAALQGTPQVVAYRLNRASYLAARLLIRTRFVALPNIVLRRPVVPELLQGRLTVDGLTAWALELLRDDGRARAQREAAPALRSSLLGPGATAATAHLLEELLRR